MVTEQPLTALQHLGRLQQCCIAKIVKGCMSYCQSFGSACSADVPTWLMVRPHHVAHTRMRVPPTLTCPGQWKHKRWWEQARGPHADLLPEAVCSLAACFVHATVPDGAGPLDCLDQGLCAVRLARVWEPQVEVLLGAAVDVVPACSSQTNSRGVR